MHEMFAWYIDNNSYVTKEIVDQLVADITVADATGQSLTQVIEERAAKGNNSSPGSMFRDVGLIDKDDNASYALRLYKTGTYPFSNLIFDLFSKRNVAKKETIPLKPLVCLCKIFTLMYDLEIPKNERFITIAEVYEYISVLDSYEEINKDLVQKIVCERVYPSGSRIPTKRMKIKGDVCLRELFHMASETLVFNLGEEKTILVPEEKYIELMQYVSLMGYKLSNAPVVDGKKTRPYCEYLTNINHGIVEIIPDVPLKQDVIIPKNMTRGVFEYLFGVTGAKNIKWDIYILQRIVQAYIGFSILFVGLPLCKCICKTKRLVSIC